MITEPLEVEVNKGIAQNSDELIIERAIMHYLDPTRPKDKLVHREINLSGVSGERTCKFLQQLVGNALPTADKIGVVPEGVSEAVQCCRAALACPENFKAESLRLAQLLSLAMRSATRGREQIKAGDLLLVLAREPGGSVAALLKLEQLPDEALRKYKPLRDGTYELVFNISNKIVTTQHPPQKCAFVREASRNLGYDVRLHDNQTRERDSAAKFFREDFLNCRLLTSDATRTKDFCDAAERWRSRHQGELDRYGIVAFTRALRDHLLGGEVSFDAFARDVITDVASGNEWLVTDLVAALKKGVYKREAKEGGPTPRTFMPDKSIAEKLVGTTSLTLSSGISLSGSTEAMLLILEASEGGRAVGDDVLSFKVGTTSIKRSFSAPRQRSA